MATIMMAPSIGPDPAYVVCPSCKAQIITATELRATTRTHIAALFLCVFSLCPCAWMPYCCTPCRDTVHKCPQCNAFIGVYKR